MCANVKPLRLLMLPGGEDLISVCWYQVVIGYIHARAFQDVLSCPHIAGNSRDGGAYILIMCAGEKAASRKHEATQGARSSQV